MLIYLLFKSQYDTFANYIIVIIIYVGELVTLKSILKHIGHNSVSFS